MLCALNAVKRKSIFCWPPKAIKLLEVTVNSPEKTFRIRDRQFLNLIPNSRQHPPQHQPGKGHAGEQAGQEQRDRDMRSQPSNRAQDGLQSSRAHVDQGQDGRRRRQTLRRDNPLPSQDVKTRPVRSVAIDDSTKDCFSRQSLILCIKKLSGTKLVFV